MSIEEKGTVVVKEEVVFAKFDGEGEGAILRERVTYVDDELVSHEFFDEAGSPLEVEGGN